MEENSGLQQIKDLLPSILQRVGRFSAKDACRAACASKLLNSTLKDPSVMQALNLSDFIADPNLVDVYPRFFNLAMSSGNPQALYLHGMRTIAIAKDINNSVSFFNKASKAGIDQATLMMAICATAYGQYPRALELLDRVQGWSSRMLYMVELGEQVATTKKAIQSDCGGLLPSVFGAEDFPPKCFFKHRLMCCEMCYLYIQYQLLRFEF